MAKTYKIYIWKAAPFLRLLLPLIAGVILEYYFKFTFSQMVTSATVAILLLSLFSIISVAWRFKYGILQGISVSLLITCCGALLTWHKDVRNDIKWYGHHCDSTSYFIATIKEPCVEKAKSYKVLVHVAFVVNNHTVYSSTGDLLLYVAKDSSLKIPQYGDTIIFANKLQQIKNSGNPGAFDYARYSSFHQLFHQVYLRKTDWYISGNDMQRGYNFYIFKLRDKIKDIIYQYIPGESERSIAAALLIGYKIDLDKDLVQAYSNAGVVHLIAISGLHMGIIYSILFWLFAKIPFVKRSKLTRLLLTLCCLWVFALLTGASGSVLRSAFMFSFIAVGLAFNRKASIYNSMAASAFILLCYNPYLLWDVGFQLSYLAVLGIVISQPNVVSWFHSKNKIVNTAWQLCSVSLAAQLFTFPICIFYFHQLPLLFLVSNLIAIPLTTIALWTCIILIIVSPIHAIAFVIGKIVFVAIWLINHTVLFINAIPFSLWDNLHLNFIQTFVMYMIVCGTLYWLLQKDKNAFKFTLACLFIFSGLIVFDKWHTFQQKKIIVYNVPSHRAIDFISGSAYRFFGDDELAKDGVLRNFHLKPGRISLMVNHNADSIKSFYSRGKFLNYYGKRILLIDSAINYTTPSEKINIDYVIISKNPRLFIPKIAAVFNVGEYIFDASNPLWKIEKWKKDCEELHLRFHSVPEQGAFITDL